MLNDTAKADEGGTMMDKMETMIDVKVRLVKLYADYKNCCGDSDEYAGAVAIAISALAEVQAYGKENE